MADVGFTSEDKITGISYEIPGAPASVICVSDSSGNVATSSPTATEVGYLAGVTSAIQTQVDTKAPSSSPTLTGTVSFNGPKFITYTAQTTTNTFETLGTFALDDTKVYLLNAWISAKKTDETEHYVGRYIQGFYREGGGASVISGGIAVKIAEFLTIGTTYNFQMSVSGNNVLVEGHGDTSDTVDWIVTLLYLVQT